MPERRRKKLQPLYEIVTMEGFTPVGDATCRKCGYVTCLYVEDATDRLVRFDDHECEPVHKCTDPHCDHRHLTLSELSKPQRKRKKR